MTPPSSVGSSIFSVNSTSSHNDRKGTEINPHVIELDLDYPESPANMGFEPIVLQDVMINGFEMDVIEVRKLIGVEDVGKWSAQISGTAGFLVKGCPNDSLYLTTFDSFHRGNKDSARARAHKRLLKKIENDKSRNEAFFYLKVNNLVLDTALAGINHQIKTETKGVVRQVGKHEVKGMFVIWTIAIFKEGLKMQDAAEPDIDAAFA
mmetsp:Transcript_8379/g.10081  ORF Transcript_8379/g.10081 Transcript_8379/m.10081 type:complete len:207 (-) Transcript_8379:90-710(-)|eukprot:CAMPEP_0195326130 /NCGR_PEP_ID=MMETSP0708-20121125/9529_1 /TAXON_ID=33640 /ORGANISM="Asterionellopsis glacialis, Strain CCMP134" /LENGTH=206 /DNA_ID=CAMNT_0040393699 /DNA_START=90 /DNA_END=710 /DNA_ORIENTATION=+